jgi:hypothetical protein
MNHIFAPLRILFPLNCSNAQENIWQFLRQNHLANRIFENYDAIVDACCKAWNALTAEAGRIKSIASREWLSMSS